MKEAPTRTQAKAARRAPRKEFAFMTVTLGFGADRFKVHFHDVFGDQFER